VERAIRELRKAGAPVTFGAVARRADVSRTYLHQHPELAARLRALSNAPARRPAPGEGAGDGESSIVALLRARLRRQEQAHREKTAALLARNAELEAQLAAALGEILRLREAAEGSHRTGLGQGGPQ
jgi:hypothetical protein